MKIIPFYYLRPLPDAWLQRRLNRFNSKLKNQTGHPISNHSITDTNGEGDTLQKNGNQVYELRVYKKPAPKCDL